MTDQTETTEPTPEPSLAEQFAALEAAAEADPAAAPSDKPAERDPAKPTGRARVDLEVAKREARREARAAYEAKAREVEARAAKLAEREALVGELLPEKLAAAMESGDFDAIARRLGRKDWADLTDAAIRAKTSPEHRAALKAAEEVEALKRELAEQRAAAERAAREQTEHARAAAFDSALATSLGASRDAAVKELSADPAFRQAVTSLMVERYNADGTELDAEQAAATVVQRARATYERLSKAFRAGGAVPEVTAIRDGARPARQPVRSVPRTPGEPTSRRAAVSHKEWIAEAAAQMARAVQEDDATGS